MIARALPSLPAVALPVLAALALAACGGSDRPGTTSAACGLAAFAGPSTLLSEFGVPNQTLSAPPARLPERVVARIAGGPAYPAIVGRADSLLVLGVDGAPPAEAKPGFGVLVVDRAEAARGVLLYPGLPVEGAPILGSVTVGDTTLPLIGVQTDPARFEDASCPLFPDSLAR